MLTMIFPQKRFLKLIVIISLMLIIGIATGLPDIINHLILKQNYEPFHYFFTSEPQFDEAVFYAPSASYFKENLKIPYETEIYEYKNIINIKYFLPLIIEGGLANILNNNGLSWMFIRVIFASLSFILAYFLAKELTNNWKIALFSAIILCTIGFGPRVFLNLAPERISQPVFFSRMNNPLIVLPFLLTGLIGLIKIHKNKFQIGIVLTGIIGGLLFYVYYYYQLAFILTLILLSFGYFLSKDWQKLKAIIISSIIVNTLALPWYFQYFKSLKSSPEYIARWSAIPYSISYTSIIIALIMVAAIFILKKIVKESTSSYFPIIMLIFSAISLQFIITPLSSLIMQPSHFSQQIINSFGLFLIAALGGTYLNRKTNYQWLMPAIGIILLIILFTKQIIVWQKTHNFSIAQNNEKIAEMFVKKYTKRDDVLAIANPYLNSVFPARFWRYRFYGFIGLSNINEYENVKRYVFIQRLFNKPWNEINSQLISDPTTVPSFIKTISIPSILIFKQQLTSSQMANIKNFYNQTNADFINNKKINYILTLSDKEEDGLLVGSQAFNLEIKLIDKEENTALYKILPR